MAERGENHLPTSLETYTVGLWDASDICVASTYNHLSSWLTDTRNLTNPSTVIFLIGNKSDLESTREVTFEEAQTFADENGLILVEAIAMSGQNVEEAFLETAKKIFQNIQDGRLDLNASESGVQHINHNYRDERSLSTRTPPTRIIVRVKH